MTDTTEVVYIGSAESVVLEDGRVCEWGEGYELPLELANRLLLQTAWRPAGEVVRVAATPPPAPEPVLHDGPWITSTDEVSVGLADRTWYHFTPGVPVAVAAEHRDALMAVECLDDLDCPKAVEDDHAEWTVEYEGPVEGVSTPTPEYEPLPSEAVEPEPPAVDSAPVDTIPADSEPALSPELPVADVEAPAAESE